MERTHLNLDAILSLESRKRAHLMNACGGFKSVSLIGTTDANEQSNLAIFSSIFHIGSTPPLIAFVMRPDSVERHTLQNIIDTRFYTINHINESIYKKAHQSSARYPKELSEFEVVGLSEEYKNNFFAPYVVESNIQMGVEFRERIDLKINGTIIIIGEIQELYFPSETWCDDGFLDLEKAGSIACSGLDSYHKTIGLERLSYAKPNSPLHSIVNSYNK